jgi:hypothetical protein
MTWHRLPAAPRMIVQGSSGRSATSVKTLAGTSDWRRALLDICGVGILAAAGADRLPSAEWPHWPPVEWRSLDAELKRRLSGFTTLGAVAPRQPDRRRLSLIGRIAGNLVVVKLGPPGDGLEREALVLDILARHPLPSIATAEALEAGTMEIEGHAVAFLASPGLSMQRQRPAIDEPLPTFESDLAERLSGLPLADDSESKPAEGLVPVHGDLTPWNLRRTPRGLVLFDWESAGWGAPGSDLSLYRRSCDEVRRPWNRRRGVQ